MGIPHKTTRGNTFDQMEIYEFCTRMQKFIHRQLPKLTVDLILRVCHKRKPLVVWDFGVDKMCAKKSVPARYCSSISKCLVSSRELGFSQPKKQSSCQKVKSRHINIIFHAWEEDKGKPPEWTCQSWHDPQLQHSKREKISFFLAFQETRKSPRNT